MYRDATFFLIGILLAIPLSVLANLLTPRLRDWLASSSKSRLHARVLELREELARGSAPFEWVVVSVLKKVAEGLICFTIVATASSSIVDPAATILRHIIILIAVALTGYLFGRAVGIANRYLQYSRMSLQRPAYLAKLAKRLSKLEQKALISK